MFINPYRPPTFTFVILPGVPVIHPFHVHNSLNMTTDVVACVQVSMQHWECMAMLFDPAIPSCHWRDERELEAGRICGCVCTIYAYLFDFSLLCPNYNQTLRLCG